MCVHACVHACVHLLTFSLKKTSLKKLLTGLLPNLIEVFLRQRLKSSLHRHRKIRPVEQYKRSSASSFPFPTMFLNVIFYIIKLCSCKVNS